MTKHPLAFGLFAFAILTTVSVSGESKPISSKGTLILFVPTRDGLIVAADSRSNIDIERAGSGYCDNAVKIVPLRHHDRTVIAVAGTDKVFYRASIHSCEELMMVQPIINPARIASSYLDGKRDEVTKTSFTALETHLLRKIHAVQALHPELLHNGADGTFAVIGLGRYIPEKGVSIVARFTVCIRTGNRADICDRDWHEYHLTDKRELRTIGEGGPFADKFVVTREGKKKLGGRHLDDYSAYTLMFPTIGDVPTDDGRKAAIDLIESTEILSDKLPGSHGVGGPIHIALLGLQDPKPQLLQ